MAEGENRWERCATPGDEAPTCARIINEWMKAAGEGRGGATGKRKSRAATLEQQRSTASRVS